MTDKRQLSVEESPDQLWDYDYYVQEHGDPATNGKGHRVVTMPGSTKKEVLVPGPPVRKVKRARVLSAVSTRVVADGPNELGGVEAIAQMQAELFAQFDLVRAVGASAGVATVQKGNAAHVTETGQTAPAGQRTSPQSIEKSKKRAEPETATNPYAVFGQLSHQAAAASNPPAAGAGPGGSVGGTTILQKTKGKAKAKADLSNGKGRPKSDVSLFVNMHVKNFKECDEQSVIWFGSDRVNYMRKFQRHLVDVGKALENADAKVSTPDLDSL
eukprot:6466676-Amphidinium_carterae.2